MCAGAILNARIPRVYYGARDQEMGACGGVLNLFMEDFPHPPALVGGVLAEDCRPGADGFLPKSPINEFSKFRLIIVSFIFVIPLNLPAKRRLFCLFR